MLNLLKRYQIVNDYYIQKQHEGYTVGHISKDIPIKYFSKSKYGKTLRDSILEYIGIRTTKPLTDIQIAILTSLQNNPKVNTIEGLYYAIFGRYKSGKGYKYSKITNAMKRLVKENYVQVSYEYRLNLVSTYSIVKPKISSM